MAGYQRAADEQQSTSRKLLGNSDDELETVRVWLLGGFRISVGARSIGEAQWRLKKAASLVKLLALSPGHRMHREQAMELPWLGLDPEVAANNFYRALNVARRVLEPSAPVGSAASR